MSGVSLRKPDWLKITIKASEGMSATRKLISSLGLRTVCESARCPNLGECWGRRTATFMILGDSCTRNCRFCAVYKGKPQPVDGTEPERVALAVHSINLKYVVITSVTRDDLPDGGSQHWADTIRAVRKINPDCKIEVLIPDFQGDLAALNVVWDAGPDVLGHNLETVPDLYKSIRPLASYDTSLKILKESKKRGFITKTGIMVGLGETDEQVARLMQDVAEIGCDILTIGQYLQPTPQNIEVVRYISPEKFKEYRDWGLEMGIKIVHSGPYVRSSYHADEIVENTNP